MTESASPRRKIAAASCPRVVVVPNPQSPTMMKVAALAALAGSAAAFAPAQQARTSTSLSATAAQRDFFGLPENVDFSSELGVQPPVSKSC